MAILDILHIPNPRLREKAVPVQSVDPSVRSLMNDMLETLYHVDGVGLAAIQVGVTQRVITVSRQGCGVDGPPLLMANPEILWTSHETQVTNEGCLSIPGIFDKVTRALKIRVSYLDEENQPQTLEASDLLADCIQHEIEHLEGILFIDHLSSLKRDIITRKLKKQQKVYV